MGNGDENVRTVLMICGSVRDGSVNAAVLRTAAELLPHGVRAMVHDQLVALPYFNPDLDREPLPPPVVALRTAIEEASALLLSTPEYAGAMPGALKNLLEWTVGGTETSGKRTGWLNPSSSPTRAAGTYASLGVVLRYTDAAIVDAACVNVPVPRALIGPDGRITDTDIRTRIAEAMRALVG